MPVRMRRAVVFAIVAAFVVSAEARRPRNAALLRVVAPAAGRTAASAHPFINVIVRFESVNGLTPDPSTFRARMGHADVTPSFSDIVENGAVVGKRAEIGPPVVHPGRNHLRFEIRSLSARGRGRSGRARAVDRLRFRAVQAEDQPPVALAGASSDVITSGVPIVFSSAQSSDPDQDAITTHWDFGDGTTSDDPSPTHAYGAADGDVTVQLTVSDGQLATVASLVLHATPAICPGCTPGTLALDATQPLEFGAVAPGGSRALAFTIANSDATPTSQLHVRVASDTAAFTVAPADVTLGPGASQPVTVTFAPTAAGHQSATIALTAAASNRSSYHALAHGFGGSAPGTGPTLGTAPLFYADLTGATAGILPDGTRFDADSFVHTCLGANDTGTFDLCTTDADCATAGEHCATSSICTGGDRNNQVCAQPADCPNGFCRASASASAVDLCGDGTGSLYIMTDDTTFTDPNVNATSELTGSIIRLQFDPHTGARTGASIVARVTDETQELACDRSAAESGGDLFVPEDFNVDVSASSCARDQREALTAFPKAGGRSQQILPDVASVAGYATCDSFDPVSDIEVSRDGTSIFISILETGLWRIRPTPLQLTPDVTDSFAVHPDGGIVYATVHDEGTAAVVRVYRIFPDQALHGAPHLADLTPCATWSVPSNRTATSPATRLGDKSFAVDAASPGSSDGIVLVSFTGTTLPGIPAALTLHGTLAIAAPAGSNACQVLGLVNLEFLDLTSF